jgi:hypothetical protein
MQLKSNTGAPAITANAAAGTKSMTQVLHNFNGLSNLDNANLTGFIFEPPDQALCVGNILGTKYVLEGVNVTLGFYTVNGTLVSEQDFFTFFQDNSPIVSDPRCVYDRTNDAFFISVVGTDVATESHFDLAVLDGKTGNITLYNSIRLTSTIRLEIAHAWATSHTLGSTITRSSFRWTSSLSLNRFITEPLYTCFPRQTCWRVTT